jgi:hypothetical protein
MAKHDRMRPSRSGSAAAGPPSRSARGLPCCQPSGASSWTLPGPAVNPDDLAERRHQVRQPPPLGIREEVPQAGSFRPLFQLLNSAVGCQRSPAAILGMASFVWIDELLHEPAEPRLDAFTLAESRNPCCASDRSGDLKIRRSANRMPRICTHRHDNLSRSI